MAHEMIGERDWLNSADAVALLDSLFPMHGLHSAPAQPRKLRLYYAACARRAFERLSAIHLALLEVAERMADDKIAGQDLEEFRRIGERMTDERGGEREMVREIAALLGCEPKSWAGSNRSSGVEYDRLSWLLYQPLQHEVPSPVWVHRSLHSADLVREVFPNPFRAPGWNKEWRSTDAVGIARRMYDTRNFDSMGELADALEESGCQSPDILLHCREEYAAHYRGCWVVDLILGVEGKKLTSACSS